jgi:WD40 repeat protein
MSTADESSWKYQVGGSLAFDSPSYIERQADYDLFAALNAGEFCYVLNSRQMGKSSLRIRTKYRLQQQGFRCASIDLTNIGSTIITPQQWYKGIAFELWRSFDLLSSVNFKQWWEEQTPLSPVQQLSRFIDDIILTEISNEKIFIFIDEIDSVLSLDFSVDDFFALIRFYCNEQADQGRYRRLTFTLFGVATPSDLIRDRSRTPFNVGSAIELHGFQIEEAQPLAQGLASAVSDPQAALVEILHWTGGQPFLTQKLCHLVVKAAHQSMVPSIAHMVQEQVIHNWKTQDEPTHLRTVRDRVLRNEQRTGRLLGVYQQILTQESIPAVDSTAQMELLLSGLVVKREGRLKIHNQIYQRVFSMQWVEQQLSNLRPYAEMLDQWVQSNFQDTSRLLQGKSLKDAQAWARDKSLSDLDYQFLAASEDLERRVVQQALEAERTREMEARLQEKTRRLLQEQSNSRLQKLLLGVMGAAFCISVSLGTITFWQYQRISRSKVEALATSSDNLFALNKRLEALIQAIKARHFLHQQIGAVDPAIESQSRTALMQALHGADEYNRFPGDGGIAFSQDGQLIAYSYNTLVQLRKPDGTLIKTLSGHHDVVHSVSFSPSSKLIASASEDKTVKIWSLDGELIATCKGHNAEIWETVFSPDGKILASASKDGAVKLWNLDGTLVQTLKEHKGSVLGVKFSPDGKMLASVSSDKTIKLWKLDSSNRATLSQTLSNDRGSFAAVAFSPDGTTLASSHGNVIKLWNRNHSNQFSPHPHTVIASGGGPISKIVFSPDGQILASGSWDSLIKLWNRNGDLLKSFHGHTARLQGIAFSPDGQTLASSSGDRTLRLWRLHNPNSITLFSHRKMPVLQAVFSHDGQMFASGSDDQTIRLWQHDGTPITALKGHKGSVLSIAFSPDSATLASASRDGTVKFWQIDRKSQRHTLLQSIVKYDSSVLHITFSPNGQTLASASQNGVVKLWSRSEKSLRIMIGHKSEVKSLSFSPNGQILASASADKTVKLWTINGTLLRTLDGHTNSVSAVAWSPDGQRIASGGFDNSIKLWSVKGDLLKTLEGHTLAVTGLDFSPNSQSLASASADGTIKLWKAEGTELATLKGHGGVVSSVAFSPNGRQLLSASEDGIVRLWNLDSYLQSELLLRWSCDWVRDYLKHHPSVIEQDSRLCKQ